MREKRWGTGKLQGLVPNNRNNNKNPVAGSWQCAVLHDTSTHRSIISRDTSSTLMRLFILLILYSASGIAREVYEAVVFTVQLSKALTATLGAKRNRARQCTGNISGQDLSTSFSVWHKLQQAWGACSISRCSFSRDGGKKLWQHIYCIWQKWWLGKRGGCSPGWRVTLQCYYLVTREIQKLPAN